MTEEQRKEARVVEGLAYVKFGSRDKFGNLRKNQGGRPKKDPNKKTGIGGGRPSNRRKVGDERRKELTIAPKVELINEVDAAARKLHSDGKEPSAEEIKPFWVNMCEDFPKMHFTPRKFQDFVKR